MSHYCCPFFVFLGESSVDVLLASFELFELPTDKLHPVVAWFGQNIPNGSKWSVCESPSTQSSPVPD